MTDRTIITDDYTQIEAAAIKQRASNLRADALSSGRGLVSFEVLKLPLKLRDSTSGITWEFVAEGSDLVLYRNTTELERWT